MEFFRDAYGFTKSANDRAKEWRKIIANSQPGSDPVDATIAAEVGESSLALAFQLERPGAKRKVLLMPSGVPIGRWSRWGGLHFEEAKGTRISGGGLLARTVWLKLGPDGVQDTTPDDGGMDSLGADELVVVAPSGGGQPTGETAGLGGETVVDRLRERSRGRMILTASEGLPEEASLDLSQAKRSAFAAADRVTRLYVESFIPI